jgi:4-alpha-glucanotransferase
MHGAWAPGPGAALFDALQSALTPPGERTPAALPFVAENLGVITPAVEALRERYGLPGMAILQFAFGRDPQAPAFRPHNYTRRLVVYTGTHDNDTTVGWWSGSADHSTRSAAEAADERAQAAAYLGVEADDVRAVQWAFIRAVLGSVAHTAIIPVQDVLGLGSQARLNRPGTAGGNWQWRLRPGDLAGPPLERLGRLTSVYERG